MIGRMVPALLALATLGAAPEQVDVLIRGGTIYTGRDAPFAGDVAVSGDRIRFVGPRAPFKAKRKIDVRRMIVAPGFVDPHTHVDDMLSSDEARERLMHPFLMQGVTTAFIGNDGEGTPDVAATLSAGKPVGINFAAYVGFGAVRRAVIGEARRTPTTQELALMRGLVARAMCEGALGLSTGLFYAPQSFAETGEVVALAGEAAAQGGIYDTHIRDESSYTVGLAAAIDEALAIGLGAGLPVHVSHIKALGVDMQGQAPAIIAKVEAAHARGQTVTADQYPWSASGTTLVSALVPLWAQDGGREALLARFGNPALAARLRADMIETLRKRGGRKALLVTDGRDRGRTLAEVAARLRLDPVAAALTTIQVADPTVASFNQSEADIADFMRQPWVMTGSDASTGHPRVYGSFARKFAKYVRTDRVVSLRAFVERSSTLAADTFGLKDRGHLRAGAFADIVVFDPSRFTERATYRKPTRVARGVSTVLVNGVVAVDRGRMTNRAGGRPLPRTPTGPCA